MTDYLPLLSRAVANLDRSNSEARRAVYDRARQALVKQLRAMNPPLAEPEITRERLALEEAIRKVEAQSSKAEAAGTRPAQAPRAHSLAPAPHPPPSSPAAPSAAAPPREPSPQAGREADVFREAIAEVEQEERAAEKPAGKGSDPYRRVPPPEMVVVDDRPEPDLSGYESEPVADRDERFGEPIQPRSRIARGLDFAKADARKALKVRLIVGGLVAGVLLVAIVIGYLHSDRILASIGLGAPPERTVAVSPGAPEEAERLAREPEAETRAPTLPSTAPGGPVAAVAQRAVLYEENPGAGEEQLQTFVGTAVWKTETVNPGPGRPPELGVRVDVEVPDRKMTVAITMQRNPDATLPASHTIEVQFTTPGDPFGGVADMPGIRAKTTEAAQGVPLAGLVVRVLPGYFLIGLSAMDADREQNLSLLRERGWLDIPFVYNNGRRAVLVIEKGTPGDRAMNEAVLAWGG